MAIVQIPLSVAAWLLFRTIDLAPDEVPTIAFFIEVGIKWAILAILGGMAWVLMQGAVIHGISEQFVRRPIQIGRAYAFALRRFFPMLGALILSRLAAMLMAMTIIGIPFAIYFGVRWSFVFQTSSLERYAPRAAISRSSELVSGNWWRVVGNSFVSGLVFGIPSAIIEFILGYIPVVGGAIATILTTPIFIIYGMLLYFDLRTRQHPSGIFNLETLASEVRIQVEERSEF